MKRFLRIAKRVMIISSIIAGLLAISVFIVIRFYEDEVVTYAVQRISENLTAKAHVENVDLTFWNTFPYASLRFSDVMIESPEGFNRTDTLVNAETIYLSFSLIDLFDGNYAVRQLTVENASLFLTVTKKGLRNWDIWKSEGNDSSHFDLDVKAVHLRETHLIYEDEESRFFTDLSIAEGTSKGNFTDDVFTMNTSFQGHLLYLATDDTEWAADRNIGLELGLTIDAKSEQYKFDAGTITIENIPLQFSGIITEGQTRSLSLHVTGYGIHLDRAISLIPQKFHSSVSPYEFNGSADFECQLTGKPGYKGVPEIRAFCKTSNAAINHRQSNSELSGLIAELTYTRIGSSEILELKRIETIIGEGSAKLSGKIHTLSSPVIDLALDGEFDLNYMKSFLDWDTLAVCDGHLSISSFLKGKWNKGAEHIGDALGGMEIGGSANLTNASFTLKGSDKAFQDITGNFLLSGTDASVQDVRGTVNGSDFQINGSAHRLLPFLFSPDEKLTVEANLNCRLLDFNRLTTGEESGSDPHFVLPSERIKLELKTQVDRLVYKTFEANHISGVTHFDEGVLTIDPLSFELAGGRMLTRFRMDPSEEGAGYLVACTSSFQDIDIRKLFASFDNFGQTFLTEKHLRGQASADIVFSAPLTNDLKIQSEKVHSLIDIRIENGELIGLQSLQDIAEYIGENKWIAPFVNEKKFAEKLNHIKFSALENVIEISNSQIMIPQMSILSSAMDITAQGTHGFDKKINYTIGFRLRDILIQKDALRNEEDDKLGRQIFLFMRGTSDHPEFGVDKSASKQSRKEEIAAEKNQVKALLREELGWFRKDSSVPDSYQEEQAPGTSTIVEWEEFDSRAGEQGQDSLTQKKNPVNKPDDTKPATKHKVPKWLMEKNEYEKDE